MQEYSCIWGTFLRDRFFGGFDLRFSAAGAGVACRSKGEGDSRCSGGWGVEAVLCHAKVLVKAVPAKWQPTWAGDGDGGSCYILRTEVAVLECCLRCCCSERQGSYKEARRG